MRELEDYSLTEIGARFRMSEPTPGMTQPLVSLLNYNGMTTFDNDLLQGRAPLVEGIDEHTEQYLTQLRSLTITLPSPAELIPFPDYKAKVGRLWEATSSDSSPPTPVMVKTKVLDPELAEIGWHRFNFPWQTGYSCTRYRLY